MSIRQALRGMLADFVQQAGIACAFTQDVACELVFLLAAYREEEAPLFPEVYLIGQASTDVLSAIAPGAERIELGQAALDRQAASSALKCCGGLATGGWAVYIRREEAGFSFGIFRAYQEPFSVSAEESLLGITTPEATSPVILLRNCAAHCVELLDGTGQHLELSLTSAPPAGPPLASRIRGLASAISANVEPSLLELTRGYLTRFLSELCQTSHGTLIGVVPHSTVDLPPSLADGVALRTRIDLAGALREVRERRDAASLSALKSWEALVRGMLNSDGVTVFATDATIRAFRVFVKPTPEEATRLGQAPASGGARSRAFALLRLRLGAPFQAVFFRSQDGHTEFEQHQP